MVMVFLDLQNRNITNMFNEIIHISQVANMAVPRQATAIVRTQAQTLSAQTHTHSHV